MLSLLLSLVIDLILLGVFYWAAATIIGVIPMDSTIKSVALTVLKVLVLVIVAILVIKVAVALLGGISLDIGHPLLR